MTSISVDEKLAARLAERAKRAGVSVDELAEQAIEEYLEEPPSTNGDLDAFAFVGAGSNPEVNAREADKLLGDGFGR
jgi:predicted transcriptional regulator